MTMEKYLMFRFVCGVMVLYNVVLGESSETVGGSLSAILNAQLLSNHNQPPATTKMNHNMHIANQMKEHIARKITHSAHILNHGKTHIPGNITPNANSQTKANEQLPAKIHQNVHIKSQGNDHIQGGKIPHNTHIQSPEKKHLPGKITRNAHTPSQEKQHLPGQITHNAHVQNHEKKHIPVPVQSERHTDNVNHGDTRSNLDHNAEKVRPSKSTSQSKNKTVPQVGNVKEQLLAKSTETKPNSQADVNDLNAAAKAIQEEALNIPVTIRIMFPHYIQVKNKWYPLKLRFGVPQP